jgi:hypothetical protein
VIITTIQAIKPLIVVKFVNHVKTVEPDVETFKYARQETAKVANTATQGTPFLLQILKIFGAWPLQASEYNEREPAKIHEFPDDQADVRIAALTMWFKTWIPAF